MEDLSQLFHAERSLLSTKLLKDTTLMTGGGGDPNPIELAASHAFPITLPDVTFNINAGAKLDVTLFNQDADNDVDGIIGTKDAILVPNTAKEAYIKYSAGVTLSTSADVTIPVSSIGFDEKLSVAGNAAAVYYKRHSNDEAMNNAFASDIKSIKTVFTKDDITALAENEALAFIVSGSLNSDLKISWSNLFSQTLSTLSEFLPGWVTLDLNLDPSISAEFTVAVEDVFALVIKKTTGNQCLLSIKKTNTFSTDFTFLAGITVSFKESVVATAAVNDIYSKVIQSVFGNSIDYINKALKAVKDKVADITQNAQVIKLINLFKLQGIPNAIDKLIDQVNLIEKNVPDAIKNIAIATAKLNFSYEYGRIDEKNELLSLIISNEDLLKYHEDSLRFNFVRLLSDMRAGKLAYTLNNYLNQETLTITNTWGLGLTIFKFSILSQTVNEIKNVITSNYTGAQMISTEGTSQYKWTLGNGSGSWMLKIGGQMPDYGQTTLDQFKFTFLLSAILKDNNINKGNLATYLDFGVVWNAIQQSDHLSLIEKYSCQTSILHQPATIANNLNFSAELTKALIVKIGNTSWIDNIPYLSKAMSAALEYNIYPGRALVTDRVAIYKVLWEMYLINDAGEDIDYAETASNTIWKQGKTFYDLAHWESTVEQGTYAYIIKMDDNMRDFMKLFINGFADLKNAIDNRLPYTSFNKIFNNELNSVADQDFYLKTAGNFMLLHAAELTGEKKPESVFTIKSGANDHQQSINFAVLNTLA